MADIKKVKKGIKCCSAANADRVCFESECPYKNQDPRSEKCCIDEMLDNGLEAIEQLEKKIEDLEERIAVMSEGGWCDAEKDPPAEICDCIVAVKGETEAQIAHVSINREGEAFFCTPDTYESDDIPGVTHWMPLPEPPKEGEAE